MRWSREKTEHRDDWSALSSFAIIPSHKASLRQ
jgi:hypothetical protein